MFVHYIQKIINGAVGLAGFGILTHYGSKSFEIISWQDNVFCLMGLLIMMAASIVLINPCDHQISNKSKKPGEKA